MSARAVDFESVNVAADAQGLHDLRALGFRGVPVVACGDEAVHGVDIAQVSALVGLAYDAEPALAPARLVARYLRVLEVFESLARQVPEAALGNKLPNRDRTYLALMNHLVEVGIVFRAVADGAEFTSVLGGAVPADELEVEPLIVRARDLMQWLRTAEPDFQRPVATYYGPQSLHAVLERCTWHTTQHVRQLEMVLGIEDVEPADRLARADLDGLPLPNDVWDS